MIELDAKYSEPSFLFFWRKFNALYNMLHRSEDIKDPIEVYFDNQIGMVEVVAAESKRKKRKPTEVAEGTPSGPGGQFDILAIIAARNEQEAKTGTLIKEFETKISEFFDYVRASSEGERLIVKIKSHVTEHEIYVDFAKIYRRYKALYRQTVGDYFFKEIEDLVEKLCDDFEAAVRGKNRSLIDLSKVFLVGSNEYVVCNYVFNKLGDLDSNKNVLTLGEIARDLNWDDSHEHKVAISTALDYLASGGVGFLRRKYQLWASEDARTSAKFPICELSPEVIRDALENGSLRNPQTGESVTSFLDLVTVTYTVESPATVFAPMSRSQA